MTRNVRLNNIKTTRNSLAKMVRMYFNNEEGLVEDTHWWSCLQRMMDSLVRAHKVEKELELEMKIQLIEKIMKQRGLL